MLASAGEMNPQIRFGEDLMSRVSYVMLNPDSRKELTRVVRGCLAKLTAELAKAAGIERDEILELTVVGNPVMHHLLLGLDPTELGGAPFALAVEDALRLRASELGLPVNRGARVYVLPCIAGHVGADTAGVILSEAPYLGDEVNLLVDVGTNAEIVLGNRDRLLAASSPTGPAFEGAQITFGQRAAPGAIERVRIDPATLEPRVPRDRNRRLVGRAGLRGHARHGNLRLGDHRGDRGAASRGRAHDRRDDRRSSSPSAVRDVVSDGRTFSYVLHEGEQRILVTQEDVRQIQLAKGALYAGCRLLMDRYGLERVDRIRLAGAFGSQIDPVHALVLGLVPDCEPAAGHRRRQRRRHGRAHRAPEQGGARRDRGGRPPRREGRDRGRAALPGALRRRDGDPARHRSLRTARSRRDASASPQGRRRRATGAADDGQPTTGRSSE